MISAGYIAGKTETVKNDTPYIVRQAGARGVSRKLCNTTEFLARSLYAITCEMPHNCDDMSASEYSDVVKYVADTTMRLRQSFLEIKEYTIANVKPKGLLAYMSDLNFCVGRLDCIINELSMGAIDMEVNDV